MNKLREDILKLSYGIPKKHMDKIMETIEVYLEKAFDAAKEEKHLGCGDYEDVYWDWKVWYNNEINIQDKE